MTRNESGCNDTLLGTAFILFIILPGATGRYDPPPLELLLRSVPRTTGKHSPIFCIGDFWLRRSRLALFIAGFITPTDICWILGNTVSVLGNTWRPLGDI